MKMLKLAACAAFLFLAGCATTQGPVDFATTATKVCSVVQPALVSVQTVAPQLTPPLAADQQANLDKAAVVVTGFCAATATANAQSAGQLMQTAFPLLMGVVANSSLPDSSRNALLLGLVATQAAASAILAK